MDEVARLRLPVTSKSCHFPRDSRFPCKQCQKVLYQYSSAGGFIGGAYTWRHHGLAVVGQRPRNGPLTLQAEDDLILVETAMFGDVGGIHLIAHSRHAGVGKGAWAHGLSFIGNLRSGACGGRSPLP